MQEQTNQINPIQPEPGENDEANGGQHTFPTCTLASHGNKEGEEASATNSKHVRS